MIKTWWDSPEGHIGNVVFSCGVDLCHWAVGIRWSKFDGDWDITVNVLCVSLFLGRWL